MSILRQKTAFGPGIYRGHKFDLSRLRTFVEGTNRAIAAGIPIPLLKRHAPINASDDATLQFSKEEGVGFLKSVAIDDKGELEWEADGVPKDVLESVTKREGSYRLTSPEFRPVYKSEKVVNGKPIYEGPIIRHWAFSYKPGNPTQGPIETVALDEQETLGCFQFSEEERKPLEPMDGLENVTDDDKRLGAIAFSEAEAGKNPPSFAVNESLWEDAKKAAGDKYGGDSKWAVVTSIYKKMGGKIGDSSQHDETDHNTVLAKHGWKHTSGADYKHDTLPGHIIRATPTGWLHLEKKTIHARGRDHNDLNDHLHKVHSEAYTFDETDLDRKAKKLDNPDEKPETTPPVDIVVPESPPVNPDAPPKATDKTKLAAVIAGMAQLGVVLPSTFTFDDDASLDVLLAGLNTLIKANNEAELDDKDDDEEEDSPTDAPMPFAEGGGTELHHQALVDHGYTPHSDVAGTLWKTYTHPRGYVAQIHANGKWTHSLGRKHTNGEGNGSLFGHLAKIHSTQHDETTQFSEEELSALSPKARAVIEAGTKALLAERKAKEEALQKAIQFQEQEKETKNNVAKDKAKEAISKARIPPALRVKLLEGFDTVQFSEGSEPARYTAVQVAELVAANLPPALQFLESDPKLADQPKASKPMGRDDKGNILNGPMTTEQFFETDAPPSGHVSSERARELVANNPALRKSPRAGHIPTHGEYVASENARVPNNVMNR